MSFDDTTVFHPNSTILILNAVSGRVPTYLLESILSLFVMHVEQAIKFDIKHNKI